MNGKNVCDGPGGYVGKQHNNRSFINVIQNSIEKDVQLVGQS